MTRFLCAVSCGALLSLGTATPVAAQGDVATEVADGGFADDGGAAPSVAPGEGGGGFVDDVGASERVNYAGRLRMLSQRIAAAACYGHGGIERDDAVALLDASMAEYDRILDALEGGDEGLGIRGTEENPRTVRQIEATREAWHALRDAVPADPASDEWDVGAVHRAAAPLLSEAQALVDEIVGRYADPAALLHADAIRIDIAGRQRMLSQRVSKNLCFLSRDIEPESARAQLTQAADLFEASANALRFGMPTAGVLASEDPEIVAGLDDILSRWAVVRGKVDATLDGGAMTGEQAADAFHAMNAITARMNEVVGLYSDTSKLDL